jgi:acyl-CoA synthetase (AMP-forming)/AMP-acid ligase II
MCKHLSVLTGSPTTVVDLLRWRALHQPDRLAYTFLVDGETTEASLTYGELDQQARAIGALLQRSGASGERALLLYAPGLEFIVAFFGCLYGGAVPIPAYPPSPAQLSRTLPRLRGIANDARPLVALTTSSILSMVKALLMQAQDFQAVHWMATDNVANSLGEEWRDPMLGSDALAFLQYTSGSTAVPKGVMVSHRNVLHNSALIHRCFELTPDSRAVSWLPPYHDMGLIGGVLQPLYGGFPVTLLSPQLPSCNAPSGGCRLSLTRRPPIVVAQTSLMTYACARALLSSGQPST